MQPLNKLILGDNLEILKQMDGEIADMIYLDPPFFSNRNYEVIWGDEGEVRSFRDRWSGGIDHYIGWLKERVAEMHRILKPTGSIFLHCNWHANAYIKIEILDRIFGINNFRNEIIWKRSDAHSDSKQGALHLGRIHDNIYYYSKSDKPIINTIYTPLSEKTIESWYKNIEPETGREYNKADVTGPGGAGKGNPYYEWNGHLRYWRYNKEKMQKLHDEGKLFYTPSSGMTYEKRYLDESKGVPLQDIWDDIDMLRGFQNKGERIGYPTQKPQALMQRIIEMSTNESDLILDPFVGGGTTIAVADKLNRRWIGIDQSVQAVKVTEFRLNNQQDLFSQPFMLQLHKYDYDTLRYKNAFEFENWIIRQYGGISNTRQQNDFGLDGKTSDNVPIQVKRSDNVGRNVIDNFFSAVQRFDKKLYDKNKIENKPVGCIIAFSFGKGAIEEVARLHLKENIIIKLVEVADIVPIAKKPTITVEAHEVGRDKKNICEIQFTATAQSAAGIEFFAWDFEYNKPSGFKPLVLIDKEGKQHHKFKPGLHNVAVKVVDNDGLDNIEIIKLKVNGGMVRI